MGSGCAEDAAVFLWGRKFLEKLAGSKAVNQSAEMFGVSGAHGDAVGAGEATLFVDAARVVLVDGSHGTLCGTDAAAVALSAGFGFEWRVHYRAVGVVSRYFDAGSRGPVGVRGEPFTALAAELPGLGQVVVVGASGGHLGEDGMLGNKESCRDDRETLLFDHISQFEQRVVVVTVSIYANDNGRSVCTPYLSQGVNGYGRYAAGIYRHGEDGDFVGCEGQRCGLRVE